MKDKVDTALSLAALQDPQVRQNPYPFYHRLREQAPIYWDAAAGVSGGWVLTRHADVIAALRDPRLTAERLTPPGGQEWLPDALRSAAEKVFRAMPHQLLFLDPPDHTRIRGLLNRAFTPRLVEGMRPRIAAIADTLLDHVRETHEVELISSYAYPLPAIVIAEMLGVPPEDRAQFIRWSSDFGALLDGSSLTIEQVYAAIQGVSDFMDYFRVIIATRQSSPRDDLLGALIVAREQDDKLSEDELLANLVLLLAAGHGTTTHLIGNGTLALLRHPDQLRRLVEDPALITTAVPELLRYDSPVQLTGRRVRQPFTVAGQEIAEGQHITVLLGAANHDPDQFPDPDALDVGRSENRILSFGYGIHFCLGAPLARVEAEIALTTLLRRLPGLHLSPRAQAGVEWEPSVVFRGLTELPLSFE